MVPSAHLEAAVLDQIHLVRHITLRIGGVAGMTADVVELADRVLERALQESTLVECRGAWRVGERVGGSRHGHHMTEADVAFGQSATGPPQLTHVLAGGYVVGSRRAGHVAVDANPVDRGGRAILFMVIGGGEFGGLSGERELQQSKDLALGDEPLAAVASVLIEGIDCPNVLRREHRNMVQTSVRQVKVLERLIWLFDTLFPPDAAWS